MAKRELPSPDVLRQLLDYDPETGKLYWKERSVELCKNAGERARFNVRYAGREALTARGGPVGKRYCQGLVLGRRLYAHRVVFALTHGWWAPEVDHINGDRFDNRICNLRSVTSRENSQNRRRSSLNTSGHVGVCFHRPSGKWTAGITIDGRRVFLGCFKEKEPAIAARKAAEIEYGFHENHGRPKRQA